MTPNEPKPRNVVDLAEALHEFATAIEETPSQYAALDNGTVVVYAFGTSEAHRQLARTLRAVFSPTETVDGNRVIFTHAGFIEVQMWPESCGYTAREVEVTGKQQVWERIERATAPPVDGAA